MAGKCVHKGCGKTFSDPEEDCVYHPGPPVFHEGQKGKYLGAGAIPYRFFLDFGLPLLAIRSTTSPQFVPLTLMLTSQAGNAANPAS